MKIQEQAQKYMRQNLWFMQSATLKGNLLPNTKEDKAQKNDDATSAAIVSFSAEGVNAMKEALLNNLPQDLQETSKAKGNEEPDFEKLMQAIDPTIQINSNAQLSDAKVEIINGHFKVSTSWQAEGLVYRNIYGLLSRQDTYTDNPEKVSLMENDIAWRFDDLANALNQRLDYAGTKGNFFQNLSSMLDNLAAGGTNPLLDRVRNLVQQASMGIHIDMDDKYQKSIESTISTYRKKWLAQTNDKQRNAFRQRFQKSFYSLVMNALKNLDVAKLTGRKDFHVATLVLSSLNYEDSKTTRGMNNSFTAKLLSLDEKVSTKNL